MVQGSRCHCQGALVAWLDEEEGMEKTKCYLCGWTPASCDASLSPAGFPNPGREQDCTPRGQLPKPEDQRCLHCYVGYPAFKEDGVTPWFGNEPIRPPWLRKSEGG